MSPRTLNRWILLVALGGMILTIHLWIQKARGFDQGCFGVTEPAHVTDNGCRVVSELSASHIFGVSNAAWGYAFYFGLALLTFAKLVVAPRVATWLHRLGEIATGGALIYSGYLVYEMVTVAGHLCALCATSAGLVLALAGLHARLRWIGGYRPVETTDKPLELGIAAAISFGAVGVLFTVVIFVNRIGTRSLKQGMEAQQIEEMVGASLPLYIDADRLAEMRACRFDRRVPTIDVAALVDPTFPAIGQEDGPTVVAFLDPNCWHCAQEFPEFLRFAKAHQDEARFVVVPRALWDQSVGAAAALRVASGSGKYFELWAMLLKQQTNVERRPEVYRQMLDSLGIPTTDFDRRFRAARAQTEADQVRFHRAGVDASPAIYIDGYFVAMANCSNDCLGKLLTRTRASTKAPGVHGRK